MRVRVTWRGATEERHPELGILTPGGVIELEMSAALAEALRADASGCFEIAELSEAEPDSSA
jgi:hypothetical protein